MSPDAFLCCTECSEKLYATFFCRECGRPSCSLACYRRHQARHAETEEPARVSDQGEAWVEPPEPPR